MKLRDHPLMRYRGSRSWPPAWLWRGGDETTYPQGEIGILKDVLLSTIAPETTCFLIMEHCGAEYMGALLISDPAFYRQICKIIFRNRGRTIHDIGEFDVSHML
ncbi:MAG TPA: hypothetical protein VIE89_24285 [Candidatus Binatia bacterium]|jgi:hypothetical protein